MRRKKVCNSFWNACRESERGRKYSYAPLPLRDCVCTFFLFRCCCLQAPQATTANKKQKQHANLFKRFWCIQVDTNLAQILAHIHTHILAGKMATPPLATLTRRTNTNTHTRTHTHTCNGETGNKTFMNKIETTRAAATATDERETSKLKSK